MSNMGLLLLILVVLLLAGGGLGYRSYGTGGGIGVVGVVIIIFGMQASASLGSRLSELFTGTPSDRTIWLLILGVVAAIVGLGLLLVGRRSTP